MGKQISLIQPEVAFKIALPQYNQVYRMANMIHYNKHFVQFKRIDISFQGCGKSIIAKHFADLLGYHIEPIMLYQVSVNS